MRYILSIDQSTSATKAYLWDESGRKIASASIAHRQIIDSRGYVQHNPEEIFQNVLLASHRAIKLGNVAPEDVACIGISNQRETVVCWDKHTGKPLYHAIVWQCARAADLVAELERSGNAQKIYERTGLPLSPYFSAAKLCWMVRHVDGIKDALTQHRLAVGTIDAWLIYRLCAVHATDYSNASRTQLLNLDTLRWDNDLLNLFELYADCMPEIKMSDSFFGTTTMEGLFPKAIPVHGVLGDSHAALLFHRCFSIGKGKVTYGTGSSIMINAGTRRPQKIKNLSVSLAWGRGDEIPFVVEGNINDSGSTLRWLCEEMGLWSEVGQIELAARAVPQSDGVFIIPAFSGLGAPWFCNQARAAIVGLNRSTRKEHLARASLESIACQVTDVVHAMQRTLGTNFESLYADGGPAENQLLMQIQADLLQKTIQVSQLKECSAAGAALCAAVGSKMCDDQSAFLPNYTQIRPRMPSACQDALYNGWLSAVRMVLNQKGAGL